MSCRHSKQRGLAASGILAWFVVMVGATAAQQPSAEQVEAIRKECRADFMSYCAGVQPGGQEAVRCLLGNTAKLSSACSSAVSAVVPSSSPPQPGRAASAPAQAPSADQDQLKAVRQACTLDDFTSHCSWIAPTNPELLLCLRANAAQISAGCRVVVEAAPGTANTPASPAAAAPAPPTPPAPPPAAAAPPSPPSAPAAAAPAKPSSKQISAVRAACRADFRANCPGVKPRTPEAVQCLERSRAHVSAACQAALADIAGTGQATTSSATPANPAATPESIPVRRLGPRRELGILRICADDVRGLCGDVPPGGGRIIACLARKASQLGPGCRDALVKAGG
jgi:hypothetical protein